MCRFLRRAAAVIVAPQIAHCFARCAAASPRAPFCPQAVPALLPGPPELISVILPSALWPSAHRRHPGGLAPFRLAAPHSPRRRPLPAPSPCDSLLPPPCGRAQLESPSRPGRSRVEACDRWPRPARRPPKPHRRASAAGHTPLARAFPFGCECRASRPRERGCPVCAVAWPVWYKFTSVMPIIGPLRPLAVEPLAPQFPRYSRATPRRCGSPRAPTNAHVMPLLPKTVHLHVFERFPELFAPPIIALCVPSFKIDAGRSPRLRRVAANRRASLGAP